MAEKGRDGRLVAIPLLAFPATPVGIERRISTKRRADHVKVSLGTDRWQRIPGCPKNWDICSVLRRGRIYERLQQPHTVVEWQGVSLRLDEFDHSSLRNFLTQLRITLKVFDVGEYRFEVGIENFDLITSRFQA